MTQLSWHYRALSVQCISILLHLALLTSLTSASASGRAAGAQAQQLLEAMNKDYKFKLTFYGNSLEDKRSKLS